MACNKQHHINYTAQIARHKWDKINGTINGIAQIVLHKMHNISGMVPMAWHKWLTKNGMAQIECHKKHDIGIWQGTNVMSQIARHK